MPIPKVLYRDSNVNVVNANETSDIVYDWYNTCKCAVGTDIFSQCSTAPQLGISGIQQIGSILVQQDQLRNAFLNDMLHLYKNKGVASSFGSGVDKLIHSYRPLVHSMLMRQVVDLKGAIAMDNIFDATLDTQATVPNIIFKHESIFSTAMKLVAISM